MVALPETFAPNDVPADDRNFEPIPVGVYKVQVIESKIEDTKSGSGQMLVLTLEILDGEYANRRLWDRLNIQNQNPQAQQIAQRALADLCLAIGITQLRDTDELQFKPLDVKVGIRQDKTGQYGPQNTVRYAVGAKTAPAAGNAAPRQAAPAARGPSAAGGAKTGAKPWNQPKAAAKTQQEMDDEIPF